MSVRLHGDTLARGATLDFAVNVWPGPRPAALDATLRNALADTVYPDERAARAAVAERHGRNVDEVLLLNGACEAFWLLAHALRPSRAACVHPSFTEPEAALRAVGTAMVEIDDAPFVVLGNPNNPTGALTSAEQIAALARPGRVLVVDESFMEFVPDEHESVASTLLSGLVVVRSLTKLWTLPGIRAGYLLAEPELVAVLEGQRQPWSVNAIACAALRFAMSNRNTQSQIADLVSELRVEFARELSAYGHVRPSAANFLLLEVEDGPRVVEALRSRGIAVRPCDSFPGLGPNYIRIAVRTREDNRRLVAELAAC